MLKIKKKIEKLLNLSLTENENEANIALSRAIKLMNQHNITKEEVYKQQIISTSYKLDNIYRLPDWLSSLYGIMSDLSGCVFTWKNGSKRYNRGVLTRITGRERDVANAFFLITFLHNKVNQLSKEYAKKIFVTKKRIVIQSYKMGIIKTVASRLSEQQSNYFNEQLKGTDLICIDVNIRVKEAKHFLDNELDGKIKENISKAKYDETALMHGVNEGNSIELNQAVAKQKSFKQLELKNVK